MSKPRITETKVADKNNVVHTILGGGGGHCKEVCPQCPWRVDQTGAFPAKAFVHSASTSYDAATNKFSCHMAGTENPKTCAGFLLRGADDNIAVRMGKATGKIGKVREPSVELHPSYKAMAIANGVGRRNPALRDCMPEARYNYRRHRKP